MKVESRSFRHGNPIPKEHAYREEGRNVPPDLSWDDLPYGTREVAVIVDDPDAPREEPWVHWLVYGIPAGARSIPEDALQGRNDFGEVGWGGPLPPEGHGLHHYHFRVYALDRALDLPPRAARADLEAAMDGHVLETAEIVGTYER